MKKKTADEINAHRGRTAWSFGGREYGSERGIVTIASLRGRVVIGGERDVVKNHFKGTLLGRSSADDVKREDLDTARGGDLRGFATSRPLARVTWHVRGGARRCRRRSAPAKVLWRACGSDHIL